MIGRLAVPDGDQRRPGILICHEGPGLDDHQRERAARFADMGFVAFALDYHGGGRVMLDREEMGKRLAELSADPERIRRIATAGLDFLVAQPQTDAAKGGGPGLLLRGISCLGAGPFRSRPQGGRRLPSRARHRPTRRRREHQGQGTHVRGERRPTCPTGTTKGVRGGNDRRQSRLADDSLRWCRAQLHPPWCRPCGARLHQVRQDRSTSAPGRRCSTSSKRRSPDHAQFTGDRSSRFRPPTESRPGLVACAWQWSRPPRRAQWSTCRRSSS